MLDTHGPAGSGSTSTAGAVTTPATSSSGAPGISLRGVTVELGGAQILRSVDLEAPAGSSLAILGPSGCGKTTLLRVVAGLQAITAGSVELAGVTVAGTGVHVPPEERNVGLVFQDWALFPHLTVHQNIVFGLPRALRKQPPAEIQALLEMVGIAELSGRMPGSLSGGQQQRVALARALAPQPSVLLLDEPFSSLDTSLRVDVRSEVSELLRTLAVTSVFVTHDQDEAFVLGDQVAVMRDGMVVQQDEPAALYARPNDPWLADFVGEADTVLGVADGALAHTELGPIPLIEPAEGAIDVLVRPEEVRLKAGDSAVVTRIEYFGHDTLYALVTDAGAAVRCRTTGAPMFAVGDRVSVEHSGVSAMSFPARR